MIPVSFQENPPRALAAGGPNPFSALCLLQGARRFLPRGGVSLSEAASELASAGPRPLDKAIEVVGSSSGAEDPQGARMERSNWLAAPCRGAVSGGGEYRARGSVLEEHFAVYMGGSGASGRKTSLVGRRRQACRQASVAIESCRLLPGASRRERHRASRQLSRGEVNREVSSTRGDGAVPAERIPIGRLVGDKREPYRRLSRHPSRDDVGRRAGRSVETVRPDGTGWKGPSCRSLTPSESTAARGKVPASRKGRPCGVSAPRTGRAPTRDTSPLTVGACRATPRCPAGGPHGEPDVGRRASVESTGRARRERAATWLILPVVICLSQRLSHACVSMNRSYDETANGSLNQLSFI